VTITLRNWTSATRRASTALRRASSSTRKRLLSLSRARQGQRLGREPSPCGSDRVERVVLAAQSPLIPGVAAHVHHQFTAIAEVTGQAGAVMAGALDGPGASADRVLRREAKRVGVAVCPRTHDRLGEHRSGWSCNDRECVLIAVRIDTNHLIHLVCKHPDRSSDSIRRVRMTSV